jgi:hypothetical protein
VCQKQFEELSLLRAQGSKLCHAIVGLPRVRNHLLEGMRATADRHTEMVGEIAALWAVVSSTTGFLDETFRVEVMDKLVAKFWRLEELCSRLERPSARIYDLLLGPWILWHRLFLPWSLVSLLTVWGSSSGGSLCC